MRIDDLKAFMVLADVGSFRTASEMLNITQPALSRRLQKLEMVLESKLILRTTRHIQLTAAGIQFLEKIRPIVVEAESAIIEMRQTGSRQRGLIRIACLPSVGMNILPDTIREYREHSPHMAFRILDGNALSVVQMVMNNQVDIGVGMQLGTQSDLKHVHLFDDSIGVICHADHPVMHLTGEELTWHALQEFPLTYNLHESGNRLLINSKLDQQDVKLNWAHQVQSLFGAVVIAKSGIALAPAPSTIAGSLARDSLNFLRVREPEIFRQIHVIERPESVRSSYLQQFLQILESHVAKVSGIMR